jgi:hypothetical protein
MEENLQRQWKEGSLDQRFSTFFVRGPVLSFSHFCGPPNFLIIMNVIFIINMYFVNMDVYRKMYVYL